MIEVTLYRRKSVGVFGLGKSGQSVIYALVGQDTDIIAWDDDQNKRQQWIENLGPEYIALGLDIILVPLDDPRWRSIDVLILSPGVSTFYPKPHKIVEIAKEQHCQIICDIELLYKTCINAKYVGITGTNGKSTTTSLISHILRSNGVRIEMGGNIGLPALYLQPLNSKGNYILELSSFQLELLQETRFNIAVLLNITKDHLDRYPNIDSYIQSKIRIFAYQTSQDVAIISIDNTITREIYDKLYGDKKRLAKTIPISTEQVVSGGVSIINDVLYNDLDGLNDQYTLKDLEYLPGKHNNENIAASFGVAFLYGIEADKIINSILNFRGLNHRLQFVTKIGFLTFINDSKATNAEATEKAVLSFDNIYWLAGGIAKEGGIKILAPLFHKIRHAFLMGEAEEQFAACLAEHNIPFSKCHNLKNAFDQATKLAEIEQKNAVILLSPACASFDQWESFEERGDAFCAMVERFKLDIK